jgi:hypothetical protein
MITWGTPKNGGGDYRMQVGVEMTPLGKTLQIAYYMNVRLLPTGWFGRWMRLP